MNEIINERAAKKAKEQRQRHWEQYHRQWEQQKQQQQQRGSLQKPKGEQSTKATRALRMNSRQRSQQHWQQPECRRSQRHRPQAATSARSATAAAATSAEGSAFGRSFLCWGVISLAFAGRVGWQRCSCSTSLSPTEHSGSATVGHSNCRL